MRPSDSNKIFNVALRRQNLPTPAIKCVYCKDRLSKINFRIHLDIGVNSYWAHGLKPPTFMIMGLAYMTSPPLL